MESGGKGSDVQAEREHVLQEFSFAVFPTRIAKQQPKAALFLPRTGATRRLRALFHFGAQSVSVIPETYRDDGWHISRISY